MSAVTIAILWTLGSKLTANCSITPNNIHINRVYIDQGN
jgi:hypothetical protein